MGTYEEFLEHEKDCEPHSEYDIERDYETLNKSQDSLTDRVRAFFRGKKQDEEPHPGDGEQQDEALPGDGEWKTAEPLPEEDGSCGAGPAGADGQPARGGFFTSQLIPGTPPEDPPARRTSDEQIEAMLASVTGNKPDGDPDRSVEPPCDDQAGGPEEEEA